MEYTVLEGSLAVGPRRRFLQPTVDRESEPSLFVDSLRRFFIIVAASVSST